MGKKSAPSAPDPAATAAAQGTANKEAVDASAQDSQINQVSPYGNVSYSGTVGQPDRTVTTTLSPDQQQIFNSQTNVQKTLGNEANTLAGQLPNQPLNFDNLTQIPQNYDQLRSDSSNKIYQGMTQNLQGDYNKSEATLRSKLAAQGLNANDEAYQNELTTFDRNKNDALQNAATTAYEYGQGEANNAYNQASQSRNQGISEALQLRDQPINELSALVQGSGALSPSATSPSGSLVNTGQYTQSPVNVAGITNDAYQNQLSAYNQKSNKLGGTVGNLAGIGAAAAYSSAAELKENKEVLPDDESILQKLITLPIEKWNYKSEISDEIPGDNMQTHLGCYAQDFQRIFGIGDGKMLNVIDLFGVVMQSIKEMAVKLERIENGILEK